MIGNSEGGQRTDKQYTEEPAFDSHSAYPQTKVVEPYHDSCWSDDDQCQDGAYLNGCDSPDEELVVSTCAGGWHVVQQRAPKRF